MSVAQTSRVTAAMVLLGLLSGCAASNYQNTADNDYFSRDMPSLAERAASRMSPLEDPAAGGSFLEDPAAAIREALMAEHDRWAGTPYRFGGTGMSGIDCSALVQNIFSDAFQVQLPRTTGSQVHTGEPITRDQLSPGDLVFFRPPGNRHVGIYVGQGRFLHASSARGVMISKLDNSYWRRYYWQARRPLEPTRLSMRQFAYSPAGMGG